MGGQAGEWAEPGAGGWRARPCPAGWDPRGPALGDGSDRAAAPTTTASGQGSHRLQAQRSCSVPALFSVPVGPACLLRARSAHTPWPLSAPRTPRPPTHYAGTGGLSRAMCLAQGCVSPFPPPPTHTPHSGLAWHAAPALWTRERGLERGGRWASQRCWDQASGSGSPVSAPCTPPAPASHPCPVPTHSAHSRLGRQGHVGLSGYVQCKA